MTADGGGLQRPHSRVAAEAELASRVRAVLAARRAPGLVAVVEGPPGIGKSHLLHRLCAEPVHGALVRSARGDERLAQQGFAVVEELVGCAPAGEHPADHAFARVDDWCQAGPVLLCVDDAHQLDAASVGVLRRLAWATRDLPLVLLIGARPFPASPALEALRRVAARYPLPALDRMGVEALVFERTGAWPTPALGRLLERAAGNPLFVGEVLRDLAGRGALRRDGERVGVGSGAAVPVALEDAVRGHLAELGDTERELLQALAVFGPSAALDELAAVLYEPPDLVAIIAETAARSGMTRLEGQRVAFTHDLYRQVAYETLDEPTRRSAHRRAAEVLGGAAGRHTATEHLRRAAAGSDPNVADALTEAARRSSAFAPAVSAELLADAEPFLDPADARREALLLERAVALFLSGQGRAAAELVAARLAEVRDRQVAGGLRGIRIRALINRGDVAEALAAIDATLALPGLPPPVARELAQVRCWVLLLDGRTAAALDGAAELRRDGDAVPPGLRTTLACAEYLQARPEDALRILGDVEREPLPGDQLSGKLTTLVWPAMFELAAHGPHAARPVIERARRLTADRGADWILPFHAFVAGGAALAAAEWDTAVAELDTGLELAQEQESGWISIAVGQRAYIDAHRSRPAQAREQLAAARRSGVPLQFGLDLPGLADLAVLEADGATRAAATLARELWSAAAARGEAWMLTLAPDVARVALAAFERGLLERVAAQVGDIEAPQECVAAPTAALTAGMAAGARELVEQAAREFAATGHAFAAAQAWEEYASLAAVEGDRGAAVAGMERALRTYEKAGASVDRGRLLARLRACGVRRGPRSAHSTAVTGWAALTPTERRVAGLVREGRTNPEIAAQLYVSPRTVQTHVSHILTKLGARSRVEVAATAPAG